MDDTAIKLLFADADKKVDAIGTRLGKVEEVVNENGKKLAGLGTRSWMTWAISLLAIGAVLSSPVLHSFSHAEVATRQDVQDLGDDIDRTNQIMLLLHSRTSVDGPPKDDGAIAMIREHQESLLSRGRDAVFSWPLRLGPQLQLASLDFSTPDPGCLIDSCYLAGIHTAGLSRGDTFEILAARSGEVTLCETDDHGVKVVGITHRLGYQTLYAELHEIKTAKGEWVEEGDVIGIARVGPEAASPDARKVCFSFGVVEPGQKHASQNPFRLLPRIEGVPIKKAQESQE